MNREHKFVRTEIKIAETIWGRLGTLAIRGLRELLKCNRFSVASGDVIHLDGHWYVTHAGLLRLALRRHCAGIDVRPHLKFCDPASSKLTFSATVYKSADCRGFLGYGDADPSNVSPLVHGGEMRIAETRAVNRALRKAYGVGICSVEEIGTSASNPSADGQKIPSAKVNGNGWNSGPKIRDWLCQVIRQHQLDQVLVKAYAIDFCRTETLKEATREQVEEFVRNLSEWAHKDRNALLCQLNSYATNSEGAA